MKRPAHTATDMPPAHMATVGSSGPIPWPMRVPFVQSLGTELHHFGDGQCELRLELIDSHMNGWEVAHGGVVMTLLDVSMALAARSAAPEGMAVATMEMKTSFLRAAEGRLRAVGKVLHQTRAIAFCDAVLHDAKGVLCAHASGTFKFVRSLGSKSLAPGVTVHTPLQQESP